MEPVALGLLLRLHRIQHHRRFLGRHFFGWFFFLDRFLRLRLFVFLLIGLWPGLLLRRLLRLLFGFLFLVFLSLLFLVGWILLI